MKISNNNNEGFTLTELIVVVAGLAILSSLAIPNIVNRIKLNRAEEVKALMNGYASDCLGKYRVYDGDNLGAYLEETSPFGLDNSKLNSLGYKIDKNKCSHVSLVPLNNDEKDLYALDFRITDGLVLKTAEPSNNPAFLNSCKNWAGTNCGLSDEQKIEFERIARENRQKSDCEADYSNWINNGGTGEKTIGPHGEPEPCGRTVWAYKGKALNSADEVAKARDDELGEECNEWRKSRRDSNITSPNGNSETINACNGKKFWFHSGNEFENEEDWKDYADKLKIRACKDDKEKILTMKKDDKNIVGPHSMPAPCGEKIYFCKKDFSEPLTYNEYQDTSCGRPPNDDDSGNGGINDPCRGFEPDPICEVFPSWKSWHPLCKCK